MLLRSERRKVEYAKKSLFGATFSQRELRRSPQLEEIAHELTEAQHNVPAKLVQISELEEKLGKEMEGKEQLAEGWRADLQNSHCGIEKIEKTKIDSPNHIVAVLLHATSILSLSMWEQ